MSLAFRIARPFAVLVVTLLLAASSIVMVGPQTLLIVPVAIGLGIVFAVRRSFWSLICLGYPFLFGFVSAWIGCKEMPGYHQTMAFVISVCVGMIGVGLVATGIWKVLPGSGASAN